MTWWLRWVLASGGGLVVLWLTLLGLGAKAGRGRDPLTLRETLRLLPDVIRLLRRLIADRSLPRGVRLRLGLLVAYLVSPIDLVPDFIPVLGYADDAVVVALALRAVVRAAGPDVLASHWPGTPAGLDVLHRLAGLPPHSRQLASRTRYGVTVGAMTTSPSAGDAPDWVPVDACTLPSADRPLRVAEFDVLFATSLRGIERPGRGGTRARLVLAGDDALPARVRRLVDAETSCCSFFTFTITPVDTDAAGAVLAVDIEVPPARTDVLDALLDRATTVHAAAP